MSSNGYRETAEAIADAMEDKKARDVVVLDVSSMTLVTDYLVVGSGNTAIQVRAIADGIEEKMRAAGVRPLHKEGQDNGRWILLDYGGVVAHVFHTVDREFYNLERLWSRPARSAKPADAEPGDDQPGEAKPGETSADEAKPLAPTSQTTRV